MRLFSYLILPILFTFSFAMTGYAATANLSHYQAKMMNSARELLQQPIKPAPISLQQARQQYFEKSQFHKAYQAILPYAQQGNRIAQMIIGYLYQYGLGVKKDLQTAACWYYLVIIPYAYNQQPIASGLKAYYGIDQKMSYTTAVRWFRMAAELSIDKY